MLSADDLRRAHFGYIMFAHEHGRQYLPFIPGDRREGETRARASRLFSCPIASAFGRTGEPYTHPLLDPDLDYATQMRFRDGLDSEAVWMEALEWAGFKCTHQAEMATPEVVGRCDSIIHTEDEDGACDFLVEYKKTEWRIPTKKHMGQCAFYMRELGLSHGFLILQHRDANDIWTLLRMGDATYFASGKGAVEILDDAALNAEIARQQLSVARATPPTLIPGECSVEGEKRLYPTKDRKGEQKAGSLTVRCPWFGKCFGRDGYSFATRFSDDGELELT